MTERKYETRDDTFLDVMYTYLVKYGLTRADETPFEHFLSVVGILHRVTYVENLTFVGDVGVISWMEREKKHHHLNGRTIHSEFSIPDFLVVTR